MVRLTRVPAAAFLALLVVGAASAGAAANDTNGTADPENASAPQSYFDAPNGGFGVWWYAALALMTLVLLAALRLMGVLPG